MGGVMPEQRAQKLRRVGFMLDLDSEMFAVGISELRKYVARTRNRVVPSSFKTKDGFALGAWVVKQRTLQRRGRLSLQRQALLKDAFFLWQPSQPSALADHPEDPNAAELTQSIEEELRQMRWRPVAERRRHFRSLVLRHHPDVSQEKHADSAIQFLADVKEWFLGGQ